MLIFYVGLYCLSLLTPGILTEKRKPFNLKFQQNDYELKMEWAELVRYDKRYVNYDQLRIFKYNRTCPAGNLTLEYNIEVGYDLDIVVQAYKFASNEYRLFPLRLQVNFCEAVGKNLVGGRKIYECGNFNGCPLRKGIRYIFCNWTPDQSQFPPFIPTGRYKLEVQGMYHSKELWVGNAYGEISRPFKGKFAVF